MKTEHILLWVLAAWIVYNIYRGGVVVGATNGAAYVAKTN